MVSIRRTLFTSADSDVVKQLEELPKDCYYLEHNGHVFNNVAEVGDNKLIQIHFRMPGGKGGFGSLLRSFRIHKSTNQLMCRNLSGRRLADVKEEERLQKWIAKKDEREKAKKIKKSEKMERLKRGPSKHEFNDQNYLRTRDIILDQTEDAIEAGMKALANNESKIEISQNVESDSSVSSSSDDSDFDFYDSSCLVLRKRKLKSDHDDFAVSKKLKVEYTSEVIFEYFTTKIVEEVAQLIFIEFKKRFDEEKQQKKNNEASLFQSNEFKKLNDLEKKKNSKFIEFPFLNLDLIETTEQLMVLGLDHLKHALESRNLKCGGSLEERASRLFSIKGLTEDKYPKNIKVKKRK